MFSAFHILTLLALFAGLIQLARLDSSLPECGYNPYIAGMFSQTSQEQWADWIARLSGEKPVQIGGKPAAILSRQNQRMFSGDPDARAFEYAQELVSGWLGKRARIEAVPYLMFKPPDEIYNAANLVIDLPGETRPEEIVVLAAHLDSLSSSIQSPAPGADDNASGAAALLEAARVFRQYRFARTLRLIFFTGEEQYEVGSRAYLADHPPRGVVGMINLDMLAYDADDDHCIELHAGLMPASQAVAGCFQDTIPAYGLDLKTELITGAASIESDQSSYWAYGIGAVLVWENTTRPGPAGVCRGTDANPYYHSANDRLEHLNLATGYAAARAGIAAAASLAEPLALCQSEACQAEITGQNTSTAAFWRGLTKHVVRP